MRRRFANIDPAKALTEPTVIVFVGRFEAFDRYLQKLVTAIGPGCRCCNEGEFSEYTTCPAVHLEDWLSRDWIQHFPNQVLSGDDVLGPAPLVLYRVEALEQSLRVFSAGTELAKLLGQDQAESFRLQ